MNPAYRTCLFCDAQLSATNRAKEHVFPQWLLKHQGVTSEVLYFGRHTNPLFKLEYSNRQQGAYTLQQGRICADCNGGWMSNLEDEVKTVIVAMNNLDAMEVSPPTQKLLALWVMKTLAIYNVTTNYRQLVPDNAFRHMYEHHEPPRGVHIELGCRRNAEVKEFHTRMAPAATVLYESGKFDEGECSAIVQRDSFILAMQLGRILARVVGWPRTGLWTRSRPLDHRLVRIFPCGKTSFKWPVGDFEDDCVLNGFVDVPLSRVL